MDDGHRYIYFECIARFIKWFIIISVYQLSPCTKKIQNQMCNYEAIRMDLLGWTNLKSISTMTRLSSYHNIVKWSKNIVHRGLKAYVDFPRNNIIMLGVNKDTYIQCIPSFGDAAPCQTCIGFDSVVIHRVFGKGIQASVTSIAHAM